MNVEEKGVLCVRVRRVEKNNSVSLLFLWLSADGGKGRILAPPHVLGSVNCSWRT